jgi:alkanesulfonate monooxygenase SsuD/methylene tetrahydromethanopterin reductase-like flavin-dependent oxidoreductase (luciferase family)
MQFFPNYNAARAERPADWARAREAEGWHGLAASDHFVTLGLAYPHLWVALTEMACATRAIPITSSFANNLFRSPVEFAQASLSLNRAASGRFEAGLGAGWVEDEIVRIGWRFPERAGQHRGVQIVRELLHGAQVRWRALPHRHRRPGLADLAARRCSGPPAAAHAARVRASWTASR